MKPAHIRQSNDSQTSSSDQLSSTFTWLPVRIAPGHIDAVGRCLVAKLESNDA